MTRSSPVEAVFFDVGGPLYPDNSFVDAVLRALDELRAERGLGPANRDRFRQIYDELRTRQSGSLRSVLATAFLDPGARQALHERTREYWWHPPGTLYPDVLPLLQRLDGQVRIGVLANQERAAVDALERDGVAPYVHVWGISALVGFEKPSTELFRWAVAEAGTDAQKAVHVGNRLDNDVRPARALGLGTVWVLRGEAPDHPSAEQCREADHTVRDLVDLDQWLLNGARGERHG